MATILVTHTDLDGAACAVVAQAHFKDFVCAWPTDYQNVDATVGEAYGHLRGEFDDARVLLIADISPEKPETYARLNAQTDVRSYCFDHHGGRHQELMAPYKWCWFAPDKCGARMLFDMTGPRGEIPGEGVDLALGSFTHAVDAYDRWQLASSDRKRGEDLNRLFKFYGFDTFVELFVADPSYDARGGLSLTTELRAHEERTVNNAVAQQFPSAARAYTDGQGRKYAVVFVSDYLNEIAHEILRRYPEVGYVLAFGPDMRTVSLRAREGGDVSVREIAERHGGGGHRSSAGFPYDLRAGVGQIIQNLLK